MEIRFLTSNEHKISEVQDILGALKIKVLSTKIKIEEIQTQDVELLVRDKLLKAFDKIGRPTMVEHTGLYLSCLNGFPGGLTQIFWDTLQADKFASLFGAVGDNNIIAKTMIGYCDGRNIHFFEGSIEGTISSTPEGPRDFQWDCIFIPKDYSQTFAQLGSKKNDISMRKVALHKFAAFLGR
jgi:XTP/dITP diphosphohydrolase